MKLKILYGNYVIGCDIIDDNNVALMVDVSNLLVTFYQFVWLLATIFAYFNCECDITIGEIK